MRFPWSSSNRRVRHKSLFQVPFVGQEPMLEKLDVHLQAAQQGNPQYVILQGPSGSGKTALMTEFRLLWCRSTKFFVAQVNANDCMIESACMSRLFTSMQTRSENIFQRLFEDTKRLRKSLATEWEEHEFRAFLASADWTEIPDLPERQSRVGSEKGDVLTQLLTTVRRHPWGVGAATIIGSLTQPSMSVVDEPLWLRRWTALLRDIKRHGVEAESALVIFIDQLNASTGGERVLKWETFWRAFTAAIDAHPFPVMVCWAGTADGLEPVQQALNNHPSVRSYPIGPMVADAQQQLVREVQRAMPRYSRAAWTQSVSAIDASIELYPGVLLTAAGYVAAQASEAAEIGPQGLAASEVKIWIDHLIKRSRHGQAVEDAVFKQFLAAWAFRPIGQEWVVDDVLPLCQLETFDLDPGTGRAQFEALLGQWVKYGLLIHDPFAASYRVDHSLVADAVRQWLYPDPTVREEIAAQRRMAGALLTYVQEGDTEMLSTLSGMLEEMGEGRLEDGLTQYVAPSFRHIVRTLTKDERLQAASTLRGLQVPLVLEMLTALLDDEEGQVRSRAVQTLSQLEGINTFPLLRDVLEDDNSDVRWIAAHALHTVSGAETVDALIPLLSDQDKEVGRIAAEGLGHHGDRRAVPHLIAAMRDNYPLLRESSAMALGNLADRRALPALQELLEDSSPQVRRSAASALACFSST